MTDVFSKNERSRIMSLIRSKNTKPELLFFKLLSSTLYPQGFRYRKHYNKLPGNPDIVFIKRKIAIFIDGDFWHGYKFKVQKQRLPETYWIDKIKGNILRDRRNNKLLKRLGWQVIRIWEHDVAKGALKYVQLIEALLYKSQNNS